MNTFNKLLENLKNLISLYKQILHLAQLKQEYIVSGDIAKLEDVIRQEYQFADKAVILERERSTLVGTISRNPLFPSSLPVAQASCLCFPPDVEEKTDELRTIIKNLQEVNQINSALVNYSHKLVTEIINGFNLPDRQVTSNHYEVGYFA